MKNAAVTGASLSDPLTALLELLCSFRATRSDLRSVPSIIGDEMIYQFDHDVDSISSLFKILICWEEKSAMHYSVPQLSKAVELFIVTVGNIYAFSFV